MYNTFNITNMIVQNIKLLNILSIIINSCVKHKINQQIYFIFHNCL